MTREQIIKSLQLCNNEVLDVCTGCPYWRHEYCRNDMVQDALALILELTEECDRLRNKPPFAKISFGTEIVEQLAKEKLAELELDIEAIRTETASLMVEKLKARLPVISPSVFENVARDVLEE